MTDETKHSIWEDRYAPQCIEDMVLDPGMFTLIKSYLDKGTICNLAFFGKQGIGKTTLALLIAKHLGASTKLVSASKDRSVAVVRGDIEEFATRMSIDGTLKIIILDEVDNMTSDAYDCLRHTVPENSDDTRFILTGNYVNKVPGPLLSRCKDFNLKFDYEAAKKRLKFILDSEKVKYTDETFAVFCDRVFKKVFPDIRKSIGYLEAMSVTGTLVPLEVNDTETMRELLAEALSAKTASAARTILIQNEDVFSGDWLALAHTLFDLYAPKADELPSMTPTDIAISEKIMRYTAEWIFRMETGVSREIYFAALLTDYYSIIGVK